MVISLFSARAGEKTTKTLDYFRKSSRWLNTVMPPIQTSDRALLKYYLLFSFSNKRFCYSDLIVIFGQCFGNFYIRYLKHIIDFLARETYSNDSSNKAILQVKMVFKSMLTNGTYVFVIYLRKNLTFLDVLIRIFTNLKLIYILQGLTTSAVMDANPLSPSTLPPGRLLPRRPALALQEIASASRDKRFPSCDIRR